ncbi:UDP-glucuronosyltransferase 2C1-like [Scyliorhinus canicula]|uniref:UDP-glucuronosyltransferase 2C1-like n=1 Tax=Scyliorhinus canicula TaxID=7830 RepID=UPI0018F71D89|nr:UDP-glucuronosyltransferase 2C1-like [Scyliorhinus canicula]XP_038662120.1 UDP-glucuronosyltransferase 2C1-like [Scyliorhinus canicula]
MEHFRWKSNLLIACTLGLTIATSFPKTHAANILIVPIDGSHWINMRVLIEELRLHGHNMTVLRSSTAWYIKEELDLYQSIVVQLHGNKGVIEDPGAIQGLIQKSLAVSKNGLTLWSFIQLQVELTSFLLDGHLWATQFITILFENKELLKRLADAKFDIILADPAFCAGPMLAYYLNVPLVYNVRWIPSGEAHFLAAPSPLSYVPGIGSRLTDKMTFHQRIQNVLQSLLQSSISGFLIYPPYNKLCHQYLGRDTDIYSILLRADVWLMRVDFTFEFPRPIMPNFVHIGGFQCKPPKPLSAQFQEFVETSGEHGIVVMSLGTLVTSLSLDITMEIAEAFAQIPQKVIWRHDGVIPPNIGNNTLLAKWIPQNDLLGHPKTRAFVSHGGTNGVYEAIYHGVPIVGLPLFYDQFDNLLRLESRGAAQVVDVATLQTSDLRRALNEVINNSKYRQNMRRLSALHRDQPETPMDRAIFWIEYTARHKGAVHLRSEFYKLPWYAYYCVDVIIFLALVSLVTMMLLALILKKFYNMILKKKEKLL